MIKRKSDLFAKFVVCKTMAGPRVALPSAHKQWSPNTCCSKKILLLLTWYSLFNFSSVLLLHVNNNMPYNKYVLFISVFISYSCGPLTGYLADVKFGRYGVVKLGSIGTFLASILYFFATFTQRVDSTLSTVFSSLVIVIVCYGAACYVVAMLPFVTDQIIGATSDELSAVVRWYYWAQYAGVGSAYTAIYWFSISSLREIILPLIFAVPLAVIIISDCLCHQWLDRTHKVTNPIKLIIQVLNYTRKHRYPERRSAFTYIDEEQPTRMDYGKEKFGGPFTEEEVEDVKTVLRLIPLVICISFIVGSLGMVPYVDIVKGNNYVGKQSNF